MSTGFSHLEHDLVELGYAAHQLIWFADSFWLHADPGDRLPPRFLTDFNRTTSLLRQLAEHEAGQEIGRVAEQAMVAAQRAYEDFASEWQQAGHSDFISLRNSVEPPSITDACWERYSPLSIPVWQEFRRQLQRLITVLPRPWAISGELGSRLSQVFQVGSSGVEVRARLGDRDPIQSLQASLFEVRNALPILGNLDIELSPANFHRAGLPYVECVQEKAAGLHLEILRRLGASASSTVDDERMGPVHSAPVADFGLENVEDPSQTGDEPLVPGNPETNVDTARAPQGPAAVISERTLSAADLRRYGDAALSCPDIAAQCGVNEDALRRRLERWRRDHDQGWHEVQNHGPREPRYLYQVGAIADIIDDMTSGETSAERSAG